MPRHKVPFKLIDFVAKTGFITKDLWRKYFFTGGNERWMHQSWSNLHEHEYLKPHPEPALKDVSVLDLKSSKNKFLWEGKPVKHVYASHLNHDVNLYEGFLKLERWLHRLNGRPKLKSSPDLESIFITTVFQARQ